MRLAIITAHAGADSLKEAVHSWLNSPPIPDSTFELSEISCSVIFGSPHVYMMNGKSGMLDAYQIAFRRNSAEYDILAYFHDDLIIHDKDWRDRVLAEFEDPQVGLVGFGGALGHGSPVLYNVPYDYHQLGRSHFLSNMVDAESHGERFTGSCDVAVLDGFALIVRREVLEKAKTITIAQSLNATRNIEYVGPDNLNSKSFDFNPSADTIQTGWPLNTPIGYVCYDYWLCCMARRLGYRIRLVGVACQHLGGRTYVKLGLGDKPDHWEKYLAAHRYIYDEFKDVLPFEVAR